MHKLQIEVATSGRGFLNELYNYSFQNFEFKDTLSTLAFGNEARGLPASYLDENSIIITHSHDIDSLNVTNALTIGLYEFNKQIMLK